MLVPREPLLPVFAMPFQAQSVAASKLGGLGSAEDERSCGINQLTKHEFQHAHRTATRRIPSRERGQHGGRYPMSGLDPRWRLISDTPDFNAELAVSKHV